MGDSGLIPGSEDPLEEETATHSDILALENPMDRGAWRAAVHGVAKSWTRLKRLSTNTPMHALIKAEDANGTPVMSGV